LAGCAPKPPSLPTAAGTSFPGFAAAYAEATAACRDVSTLTLSMALSGKAGSTKLRGRIDAGFAAPARARLEGLAPFGKPVFVLVADGRRGTLVLTRENRVLRDAPPDQIVEALAGVTLGADALRTIVSGCGFGGGDARAGTELQANGSDWAIITLSESTAYLIRRNGWHLVAATRGALTVRYANYDTGRPTGISIRATSDGHVTADIQLRLSDVESNATLDPRTFVPDVPGEAAPMTLEELRRAGPLGGS
jgi:outer membrane lipoprotein-sorting protein